MGNAGVIVIVALLMAGCSKDPMPAPVEPEPTELNDVMRCDSTVVIAPDVKMCVRR